MLEASRSAVLLAVILAAAPRPAAAATCMASWYGYEASNRRTASGEPWRPSGLSVAHRTLPFGTVVRVTFAGRSLDLRVNDRGPFVRGRCLDLSAGAARALGMRVTSLISYEVVGSRSSPIEAARHGGARRPGRPVEGIFGLLFGVAP